MSSFANHDHGKRVLKGFAYRNQNHLPQPTNPNSWWRTVKDVCIKRIMIVIHRRSSVVLLIATHFINSTQDHTSPKNVCTKENCAINRSGNPLSTIHKHILPSFTSYICLYVFQPQPLPSLPLPPLFILPEFSGTISSLTKIARLSFLLWRLWSGCEQRRSTICFA